MMRMAWCVVEAGAKCSEVESLKRSVVVCDVKWKSGARTLWNRFVQGSNAPARYMRATDRERWKHADAS